LRVALVMLKMKASAPEARQKLRRARHKLREALGE
jgi:N-acetylmuramic acid 6-phosphate (MurNAc-6-P) etherase